jgi:hypothetical protein
VCQALLHQELFATFIQGPLRLYESIFIGASLLTQKVIDYSKWKKAFYFIY